MSANTSTSRGKRHQASTSASGGLKPLLLVQQHVAGPSHITLFLTNLRLLDLDLREDWPDIKAVTFSTKDVLQNQKKRIQSVEWALYRLFEIWDPEETRNKVQPFFPPLEPLQSLNLRAALFRCLEHAKKAGALGRDTVLRKTMLDECKGERLDEVLSVFSTTVLKKVVLDNIAPTAIAHQLAMENFSYTGERTALSALILAHKASLSRALVAKNISKADYDDFANLLNLKERQIARRREQLKVILEEKGQNRSVSSKEASDLQDRAQMNWTGGDEWLETILHGDSRFKEDGVLKSSFRKIWSHVETGSLGEIEDQKRTGLLEQLDARVRGQNYRLTKWQDFKNSLNADKSESQASNSAVPKTKGIDIGFNSHRSLQTSDASKTVIEKTWIPLEDYARLMQNMQEQLQNVSKPSPNESRPAPRTKLEREIAQVDESLNTDIHNDDLSSDSESTEPSPSFEMHAKKSTSQSPPSEYVEELPRPVQGSRKHAPKEVVQKSTKKVSKSTKPSILHPSTPSKQSDSAVASEILASVLTNSPSPTKPRHVLSLAERTRLSMSRAGPQSHPNSDSDEIPELTSLTQKLHRDSKQPPPPDESQASTASTTAYEDLVSRTRQSMFGLAEIEKKACLDRRRSLKAVERNKRESRINYFPKPLQTTVEVELDEGIDKKKLIEGEAEADYESVFRTRPKIKTSPLTSPVKAWGDMGGQGTVLSSSSLAYGS